MTTRSWSVRAAVAIVGVGVVVAGCSSTDDGAQDAATVDASTPEAATGGVASEGDERQPASLRVVFDGSTCAYDGPSEIGPGAASVEYMNDSDSGGAALLLRLVDDATVGDFVDAHQPEPFVGAPLEDLAAPVGAIPRTQPQGERSSTFTLDGGAYVVLCLVDTEDADDPASYLAQPAGVTVSG